MENTLNTDECHQDRTSGIPPVEEIGDEELRHRGLTEWRAWIRMREPASRSRNAARKARRRATLAENGFRSCTVMTTEVGGELIKRLAKAIRAGRAVDEALSDVTQFNREAEKIGILVLNTSRWKQKIVRRLIKPP